jgi:hypothetical protein
MQSGINRESLDLKLNGENKTENEWASRLAWLRHWFQRAL